MRYDRLTILLARIIADQDDYGYYIKINKFNFLKNFNLVIFP